MPDALPVPDDLIALQCVLDAARAELDVYVSETEAARRLEYPDPEQIVERQTWPAEISERHLALRAAAAAAATAVRQHPTMQQALAEGCHPVTEQALKDAARAVDA
ncbi:hypothetical protein OG689_11115 [Kitasatospora sp. NBC_00240]|uniref:hypothetical protein n=1 Tax=Kitasatospora sp. NBC_00240 TaxID=2903567 RepID=UPI0022581C5D|nr:hypothetical protein [Kitasatospora sp. NBC_00240]MCX5209835.1 hypothetical protein [Kitasatospora sp. NBC_00240]